MDEPEAALSPSMQMMDDIRITRRSLLRPIFQYYWLIRVRKLINFQIRASSKFAMKRLSILE